MMKSFYNAFPENPYAAWTCTWQSVEHVGDEIALKHVPYLLMPFRMNYAIPASQLALPIIKTFFATQ